MTGGSQAAAKVLFQSKPAVIGGDSDAHVLSFIRSKNNPASLQTTAFSEANPVFASFPTWPAGAGGWNGNIPSLQAGKHSLFFASGYQPKHASGAIDNRVR